MNFQNLPEEARKLFVPAPGYAFVFGDFSNLELRVMAYEFDDEVLQDMFARGLNIHDENTKVMFGITPSHKDWKHIRRAAKVAVFGRSYGGGIRGIYERVSSQVPELSFTMAQFRLADKRYFERHPKLAEGFKRASSEAKRTRKCTTETGRVRFFLGTPDEVEREGINTPIQGAAGDIENESLIELYDMCEAHRWKLVATVHDSNGIECPIADVHECAKVLKETMEKPRFLWGKTVVFPADISVSTTSWGEMKDYGEWCEEQKASRKASVKRSKPKRPRSTTPSGSARNAASLR